MKKLTLNVLKGLLVLLFFTSTSIILSTAGVKTVSEVQANVTEAQVVDYLEEYGYEVVSAAPKSNSIADWTCHTIMNGKHYWTTVKVVGNNIIEHTDVPF